MPHDTLPALQSLLVAQGAAASHLPRLARLRELCERSPHCLGLALVGSFAQGRGDRISDLDLAAFVADDRETEFLAQADAVLGGPEVLNVYGQVRPGQVAFRKYVYLDFSSCEFHAFHHRTSFRLRRPFVPVWDPNDSLARLVVDEAPPGHETFEPYPHGDEGLVWELVDCIKWLQRGRTPLAKSYLARLGQALDTVGGASVDAATIPECRPARPEDFPALQRMLELYQHDISDMYDQDLDERGEYGYDLHRHLEGQTSFAHVAMVGGHYAGFALVGPAFVTQTEGCWMEQFFVLRKYRRGHVGAALARHVFESHPGAWEVGQMPANLPAQAFWRKVIGRVSEGRYTESRLTEGRWKGVVQRFRLDPAK